MRNREVTGYVFLSGALFLIAVSGNYLIQTKKLKKEFFEQIETHSKKYKENSDKIVMNFTDDSIEYTDFQYHISAKWEAFSGYQLIDDILFINQTEKMDHSWTVHKAEVGPEKFEEIVTFVKGKLEARQN